MRDPHRYRHVRQQQHHAPRLSAAGAAATILLSLIQWDTAGAVRRLPTTDYLDSILASSALEHDGVGASNAAEQRGAHRILKNEDGGGDASSSPPEKQTGPLDHLVTSLPLLDDGSFPTRHYAGHVPASSDGDKKFFYWMFEPDASHMDEPPSDDDVPLIIWLNGGPGCSSMDGMFLEHGPFRIVEPDTPYPYADDPNANADRWRMEINPYSWHRTPAYTLYIDQPVGTGLSFTKSGKYCKNDLEVNIDFYYFLAQFFLLHKEAFLAPIEGQLDEGGNQKYRLRRPLYFSGESHAGHYIPSMIDFILRRNGEEGTQINIPVAGAAIGNGWVDPYWQYAGADAAYGMGLIDMAQKNRLDEVEKKCQSDLDNGRYSSSVCFNLLDDIIHQSDGEKHAKFKVSQYDTRKWELAGRGRSFPPGHKVIEAYLGNVKGSGSNVNPPWDVDSNAVLEALHASEATEAGQIYKECTDPPYNALAHQDGLGVVEELVRVLDSPQDPAPVQMLFFNGVTDLICNHVGNERFLSKLPWEKINQWTTAERYVWRGNGVVNDGTPVGYMKEYDNLHFLKILNSGHMVPLDQPQVAIEMMSTFVYHGSFEDSAQSLGRSAHQDTTCEPCPPAVQCNESNAPAGDNGASSSAEASPDDALPADDGGKSIVQEAPLEDQAAVTHSIIAMGWLGALLGCFAMVLYAVATKRRQSRQSAMVLVADSDDEYGVGGNSLSVEVVEAYRDRPGSSGMS